MYAFKVLFSSLINLLFFISTGAVNNVTKLGSLDQAGIGSKICMTDLGCFEVTKDFFHIMYRPINFLPLDRQMIDTQFHLYTKRHPMEYHTVKYNDQDSMKEIDVTHKTVFIVPGFIDSKYYGKWMDRLKDNILISNDANVIIVDWSKGNFAPYTKAAANARVVGAEIALLIQNLVKYRKLDVMKVQLVGHSLGAHIAGYAGERLKTLGRITALDPAAPYFQNMPPSVRLDPTDADFVDVIHTDSSSVMLLALGMSQAVGHVDFYPNNGMKQPGCTLQAVHSIFLEGLVDATRHFISCNHQRAVDLYIYSINYRRAPPVGFLCTSWTDFLNGHCSDCSQNRCATMGLEAEQYRSFKNDTRSVKMYLTTTTKAPYWEHTYHVTIKLLKPKSTSYKDRKGSISLHIEGSQSSYDVAFTANDLIHGASYSYLVRETSPLGKIKSMTFSWKSKSFLPSIFSKHTLYLEYVVVKSMNAGDEIAQKKQTQKFCNKGLKPINSAATVMLTTC